MQAFLGRQAEKDFSYQEVGATEQDPPSGFAVNHTRVKLGEGPEIYGAARDALLGWQQLQLGWVHVWPVNAPLERFSNLAIVARFGGVWWLNACRIVYRRDRQGSLPRLAVAYGTLPDHIACGEERFQVDMDAQEKVWFDLLAYSRPNSRLARLGYPVMRNMQRRFGRDSARQMVRAIALQPNLALFDQ